MMEPDSRGFFGGNLLLPLIGIAVIVVIVLLFVTMCTGGDDKKDSASNRTPTPEPTQQSDTSAPEGALAAFVQTTLNAQYAGPCAGAQTGGDASKVCSTSRGEREGVVAYVLGKTLSEGDQWAFLEQRGGAWQVVSSPKITADNRDVPGVPWPLKVGAVVEVTGTGSCLNVRTEPGGAAVDCIADGTRVTLTAGPRQANDLEWWQPQGRNGWIAADYLRYPDAKTNATPAPRATATPGAGATGTPRP
jgi:hypothetical protein